MWLIFYLYLFFFYERIIQKWGIPPKCLWTTAHTSPINALPPTPRWRWRPIMRRHPAGASTISPSNTITNGVGTRLPLPTMGEQKAIGGMVNTIGRCIGTRTCIWLRVIHPWEWDDGTLAHSYGASMPSNSPHHFMPFVSMGGECIPSASHTQPPIGATRYGRQGSMAPLPITSWVARPSPSLAHPFLPTRSPPSHPPTNMVGSKGSMAPLPTPQRAAKQSLSLAWQTPAHLMMTALSNAPSPPPTKGGGATAAEHRATITLHCWKRRIWLSPWFSQQALQRQKPLHLQSLGCGALAYNVSFQDDRCPPPTPPDRTSDPKVLCHPFRDRSCPLPQRRWAQQSNHTHCHLGQRHWSRAPNSGGGPLCMPLCFWATQTVVAALDIGDWIGWLSFRPYGMVHA